MNKRIKKKKDTVTQWNGVRIITLSTPRWKRRKARMKMSRRVKIALIGGPNKNHRVYPVSTIREAIQRFESTIKLTPADNPDNILFEKDIEFTCDNRGKITDIVNSMFKHPKTTP